MQEMLDQFDKAVAQMVTTILTSREQDGRSAIPEPIVNIAAQATVNALTRLTITQQFDGLLRATRILAITVCPEPEQHQAVKRYCVDPLGKDWVSNAIQAQVNDSLPTG
jgi:hypothetical protein